MSQDDTPEDFQAFLEDNSITTYTGRKVRPLPVEGEPASGDIHLLDIAHALSQICRYGGHTKQFYSVAQHSVLASRFIDPEHAKWGLFHDAAEAYLGDMTRPVKCGLFALSKDYIHRRIDFFEIDLLELIATKFDLPWPPPWLEIEAVDRRLMRSEGRLLMTSWGKYPGGQIEAGDYIAFRPISCAEAEKAFLDKAAELGIYQDPI